jgi:hypothetical protein
LLCIPSKPVRASSGFSSNLTKHLKDKHGTVYQDRTKKHVKQTRLKQHDPVPYDAENPWDDKEMNQENCREDQENSSDEEDMMICKPTSGNKNAFSSFEEVSRRN